MAPLPGTPSPALYRAIIDTYRSVGFGNHREVAVALGVRLEVVETAWSLGWMQVLGPKYGPIVDVLVQDQVETIAEMERVRQAREAGLDNIEALAVQHLARTREAELGLSSKLQTAARTTIERISTLTQSIGAVYSLVERQLEGAIAQAAAGEGPMRELSGSLRVLQDIGKLQTGSVTLAKTVMELERMRLTGLPDGESVEVIRDSADALTTIENANKIATQALDALNITADDLRKYGTLPDQPAGASDEELGD